MAVYAFYVPVYGAIRWHRAPFARLLNRTEAAKAPEWSGERKRQPHAENNNAVLPGHAAASRKCITIISRSITMHVTSKGQVTIPQDIRNRLGLLPHTEVEFEMAGDHARIRKARQGAGESTRGRLVLVALRGTGDVRMSTDEIMALTRGEPRQRKRRHK